MEMPLMRPWRPPLKHVIVKKKRCLFLRAKKISRDRRSRDDLQRHHERHSCKNRSAREIRQDRDHEGGGPLATTEADFFKAAPSNAKKKAAETPERARSAAQPAKHRHPVPRNETHTAQKEETSTKPGAQSFLFFPTSCQSSKRCGLMFARRQWERIDLAPSMSSVSKALSRAIHSMQ